jgi:predicted secreted protein
MQIGSLLAVYFVVWWLCFILVLPIGSRSQAELGTEIVRGSDPGAPAVLRMWPKLLATTLLAAAMTALLLWGLSNPVLKEYWN